MTFTIVVDRPLVIIIIYLVCLISSWEKEDEFYRNNAFPLYNLYGHALAQEPLPKGVIKVTILVDPSFVIITIFLVFLIHSGSREENYLRK